MTETRSVRQIVPSTPTLEGAGVRLRRAFGFEDPHRYDPFLLLDHFRSDRPEDYRAGFPWHPHRGIETITYVLEGEVEHSDSLGNRGVIGPGGVQWMTAGSGIIHQEMPRGDGRGRLGGFQLWANLPRAHKMTKPRYQEVTAAQIPEVLLGGGARVKVIAGELGDLRGPVRDVLIEPTYLDVSVPAGGEARLPAPRGLRAFAYAFEGAGGLAGTAVRSTNLLIDLTDGDEVIAQAPDQPLRFLLVTGRPLNEPIAWRGPIVMSTEAELRLAFEEYRNGVFVKS